MANQRSGQRMQRPANTSFSNPFRQGYHGPPPASINLV